MRVLNASLNAFYQRYDGIHLLLTVAGNCLFFAGSISFAFGITVIAKACFILGSFNMLVGSLGDVYVKKAKEKEQRRLSGHQDFRRPKSKPVSG